MRTHARIGFLAAGFVACALSCCPLAQSGWAQTNSPAPTLDPALEEAILKWQSRLATLEQLQAQHEATVQAIDRVRQEIALVMGQSVSNTVARIDAMSDALAVQREQDLKTMRDSNRRMLTAVLGLAGLLFLGILFLALISTRAMNRLAAIVAASPFTQPLPQLHASPAASSDPHLLTIPLHESSTAQLQSAIKRLENRISELENLAGQKQSPAAKADLRQEPKDQPTSHASGVSKTASPGSPRVALTVGEGAALGFLPSDVGEPGAQPKSKFLPRLQKLFAHPSTPVEKNAPKKRAKT